MLQIRKPSWLKTKIPSGTNYNKVKSLLRNHNLHTVCEEAACPNIEECFNRGTATFLILGNTCTRNCKYCNVKTGQPTDTDIDEPLRVAESVNNLNLNYIVITSVTRDDLVDGGAEIFAFTIKKITNAKVEVLIPDFQGNTNSLKKVIDAMPFVLAHNIETTEKLFPDVRPQANYARSINLLKNIKKINPKQKTKSGFMIGLGESRKDILRTIKELRRADVDILSIGQYLQPNKSCAKVKKYYQPEEFKHFRKQALLLGFKHVESSPLTRSSYHAEDILDVASN